MLLCPQTDSIGQEHARQSNDSPQTKGIKEEEWPQEDKIQE